MVAYSVPQPKGEDGDEGIFRPQKPALAGRDLTVGRCEQGSASGGPWQHTTQVVPLTVL